MSDHTGAVCIFVLFPDGMVWGPRSRQADVCQQGESHHVHCQICQAHTPLYQVEVFGIDIPRAPAEWAAIVRGTSSDTHPACEHWIPITPRITTPKD